MKRDKWLELATRCEKATGSDRDIERCMGSLLPEGFQMIPYFGFTGSLDAITALIERELPGWYCTSTHIPPEFRSDETLPFDASLVGNIREEQFGYDEPPELTHAVHPGAGATEPLARCAAFCRTMAAGA